MKVNLTSCELACERCFCSDCAIIERGFTKVRVFSILVGSKLLNLRPDP